MKTLKTALETCADSCLAIMGGCKDTVQVRCCHWLATSAAFAAKDVNGITIFPELQKLSFNA